MGAEQVGIKFVQHYFEALSARPDQLHTFYSPDSTYSCGHCTLDQERDQAVQGLENIRAKILAQRFEDCRVNISTIDVHAVNESGVLVMVYGALARAAVTSSFVHTFFLMAETVNERYFISNAMFRALDEAFPTVAPPADTSPEEHSEAAPSPPTEAEPEGAAAEEAAVAEEPPAPPAEAVAEAPSPTPAPVPEPASYAAMAARQPQPPQEQHQQNIRTPKPKPDQRKKLEQPADKAPPRASGIDARTLFVKTSKESPLVDEAVMELLRPLGAVRFSPAKTHAYVEFSSAAVAQGILTGGPLLYNGQPLTIEAKRPSKNSKRSGGSNRGSRSNARRGRGRDRGQ